MTPTATTGKPQRLRRAERYEAILASSAEAFANDGYAATSVRAIADACGVTPLILYNHFDSKEELYRTILRRAARTTDAEFRRGVADGVREGVSVRAFLGAARKDRSAFMLLWRHASRERAFAADARRLRANAVVVIRDWLVTEAGYTDDVLVDCAAENFVGTMVEHVLTWLEFGNADRDEEFVGRTARALAALTRTWMDDAPADEVEAPAEPRGARS